MSRRTIFICDVCGEEEVPQIDYKEDKAWLEREGLAAVTGVNVQRKDEDIDKDRNGDPVPLYEEKEVCAICGRKIAELLRDLNPYRRRGEGDPPGQGPVLKEKYRNYPGELG